MSINVAEQGASASYGNGGGAGQYATPTPGASLMLSFRPIGRKVLIIGTGKLAATRIISMLEADVEPVVVGVDPWPTATATAAEEEQQQEMDARQHSLLQAHDEVRWRVEQGQCRFEVAPRHDQPEAWSALLDRIDGVGRDLFAVSVTDTLHSGDEIDPMPAVRTTGALPVRLSPTRRAVLLSQLCRTRRIPINVADHPDLCDFSFPAAHRFNAARLSDQPVGTSTTQTAPSSALQIAVTTNGKGCRLATRIRREIVSNLPANVGDAVERIGEMREMARSWSDGRLVDGGRRAGPSHRDVSLRRKAIGVKENGTTSDTMSREVIPEHATHTNGGGHRGAEEQSEDDLSHDTTPLNSPVPQLSSPMMGKGEADYLHANRVRTALQEMDTQQIDEDRKRRMRWVAQMSEYWPISHLGAMSIDDMRQALETYAATSATSRIDTNPDELQQQDDTRGRDRTRTADAADGPLERAEGTVRPHRRASSQHSLSVRPPLIRARRAGHIYLVGSGPGHPGLLTAMAYRLLTAHETDLVLSDKLVPASILALIPSTTQLRIARKFPGNAEGAQSELIALALEAAQAGKQVIRLKQGDPFVYGRGGEEVLAFARASIGTTVVPGISSALAAPLLLGIPVTQRGAADSMTLCTGVGRGGKVVSLPGYERGRSLVILMGVARIHDVVQTLCHGWQSQTTIEGDKAQPALTDTTTPAGSRRGAPFPPYTPIAVIERASSKDQRLVASTLDGIEGALKRCGDQRPPGMILIGWTVMSLDGGSMGNVDILDDEQRCEGDAAALEHLDRARVTRWLGTSEYIVREGLQEGYKMAATMAQAPLEAMTNSHADSALLTTPPTQPVSLPSMPRDETGWAPPRYGVQGKARGGWGYQEEPIDEAKEMALGWQS